MERNYTNVGQSKVLRSFLPVSTADMSILEKSDGSGVCIETPYSYLKDFEKQNFIPCWSLSALVKLLPENIKIKNTEFTLNIMPKGRYSVRYEDEFTNAIEAFSVKSTGMLIDDCVSAFLKLNDLKAVVFLDKREIAVTVLNEVKNCLTDSIEEENEPMCFGAWCENGKIFDDKGIPPAMAEECKKLAKDIENEVDQLLLNKFSKYIGG